MTTSANDPSNNNGCGAAIVIVLLLWGAILYLSKH